MTISIPEQARRRVRWALTILFILFTFVALDRLSAPPRSAGYLDLAYRDPRVGDLVLLAYLDPGVGSLVLQALIATFAAISIALKLMWKRIKRWLGFRPVHDAQEQTESEAAADE